MIDIRNGQQAGDPETLLHRARLVDAEALARLLEVYRNYLRLVSRIQVDRCLQSKADVSGLMAALSEDHREVLTLHQFQHLSFGEVATRMDRTEDAVKKLWVRALAALRGRNKTTRVGWCLRDRRGFVTASTGPDPGTFSMTASYRRLQQ